MHNIHLCGHSLFVKMTALPSFCSAASLSCFLPACNWLPPPRLFFFLCLLLPHLCLPGFQSAPLLTLQINIQRRSCLWWVSSTESLMRKIQTLRSLYLCLYLLVIAELCSSLCLRRRSMWWWSSETQPLCFCFLSVVLIVTTPCSLLCVDVDASKHMYCIFPVDMHQKLNIYLGLYSHLQMQYLLKSG